jgi:hypothetical protein
MERMWKEAVMTWFKYHHGICLEGLQKSQKTLVKVVCILAEIWTGYFPNGGGAHGSIDGWGIMLQAGRSRVRFPMSRIMALGSTQPLTEMSTRNLPGGKVRLVHEADNLTAICEPIV